jgi:hypothetical protein
MEPDEEFRKNIKEHVMGVVRNIARSEIDTAWAAEIKRVAATKMKEFESSYSFTASIHAAVKGIMNDHWGDIRAAIDESIREKVAAAVMNSANLSETKIRQIVENQTKQTIREMIRVP